MLAAVLREIFEESAYERFCLRHECAANPDSYRRFLRELEEIRRTKISCC
jgi:hypothetical protein